MRWKWMLIIFLFIIVVVFTAQNSALVDIKFLGWSFYISKAVILFGTLVMGIFIGVALTWRKKKN